MSIWAEDAGPYPVRVRAASSNRKPLASPREFDAMMSWMTGQASKTCTRCRKIVDAKADVCLKCGADLRPSRILLVLALASAALAVGAVWMSVVP